MGKKTTSPRGTTTTPRTVSSHGSTNGKGHDAPPAKAARRAAAPAPAVAKAPPQPKPRTHTREPRASRPPGASGKKTPSPSRRNGRAQPVNIEQIAIRAYFISERRQHHGLPGDPAADWFTAEQELIAEIRRA